MDPDHLLFVATDRISAYDVILNQTIPDKGRVLTGLSLHFFDLLDTPNHLVTTDLSGVDGLPDEQKGELSGRAMVSVIWTGMAVSLWSKAVRARRTCESKFGRRR